MNLTRLLEDGLDRIRIDLDARDKWRATLIEALDAWVEEERTAASCPSTWPPSIRADLEAEAAEQKRRILSLLE